MPSAKPCMSFRRLPAPSMASSRMSSLTARGSPSQSRVRAGGPRLPFPTLVGPRALPSGAFGEGSDAFLIGQEIRLFALPLEQVTTRASRHGAASPASTRGNQGQRSSSSRQSRARGLPWRVSLRTGRADGRLQTHELPRGALAHIPLGLVRGHVQGWHPADLSRQVDGNRHRF